MLFNRNKNQPAEPAAHQPAISYAEMPSGIVSLAKTAAVSLEKHGLAGERAAVYLVVDRSYSMHGYFANNSVQHLADQVLGLSVNLDDDGTVPLVMFDSNPYPICDIRLDRYQGVVAQQHSLHGGEITMGGTRYTIAMKAVVQHYLGSKAKDPALVVFQTDGSPQDDVETRQQLAAASKLPMFWSFVGFGPSKVRFLTELDTMPGRELDNASYFHAGAKPTGLADSAVYDGITKEFGTWVPQARAKGLLR